MPAKRYDTVLECGATFTRSLLIKNADGTLTNLTDWTAAAKMRATYPSTTAYNFTVNVDVPQSRINMSMSFVQTRDIPAGRYVYDLEASDAGGNVIRIIEGVIIVKPEATRA